MIRFLVILILLPWAIISAFYAIALIVRLLQILH